MTSDKPPKHNLQVQINKQTTITSLKKLVPDTVAAILVDKDSDETPEQIRERLIAEITV